MKGITVEDTLTLSIPERIQLVEDIWDTIVPEAETLELSDPEKKIIDERLEAHRLNPESGASWEEVYKRIVKRDEI